jgi:hypothetical protein
MGESLTMRRRVSEEGLRVVKLFRLGTREGGQYPPNLRVPGKEAPANSVPAAAVIRRVQALIGFIGRKGRVGGFVSQV